MYEPAARDYDYVEWNGRSRYVAAAASMPEPALIDTTEIWLATERELRYWTNELGVSVYDVRNAIEAVGTRAAAAVRTYLAV